MKDRLIELLKAHCLLTLNLTDCTAPDETDCADCLADHLLANGVIVPPFTIGQTTYIVDFFQMKSLRVHIREWIAVNSKTFSLHEKKQNRR